MKVVPLALAGFGSAGQAFGEMLLEKATELRAEHEVEFVVVGISTGRHGTVLNKDGLDIRNVLERYPSGSLEPQGCSASDRYHAAMDGKAFVREARALGAAVLVECIPTNHDTGEPALSMLRTALEEGMHAVSANKGPVVFGYQELTGLAKDNGVKYLFETAVMDGVPVFNLWRHCLKGARVTGFEGVLNSSTNVVLSLMEEGKSFEEAADVARKMGILEADPSADIDGWDAAVKVACLRTVLMKCPTTPADVTSRDTIRNITPDEIAQLKEKGKRYKVVCTSKPSVTLTEVDPTSPFYNLNGASAVLTIFTDTLSPISIVSTDPTIRDTAYGMFVDCLSTL